MQQNELDILYHLVRVASNSAHKNKDVDLANSIRGIVDHLLGGGDYLRLLHYLSYYGEHYLVDPTFKLLEGYSWKPDRIVEFGAGNAWLSRGLALKFGISDILTIDKRFWTMIDVVADLETQAGIDKVKEAMRTNDVIVMADFLHCVDNIDQLMHEFAEYKMAILEYAPIDDEMWDSYYEQLVRYGAQPLELSHYEDIIRGAGRVVDVHDMDPYVLMVVG